MAGGAQEEEKAILIVLSLLIDVMLELIQEKVVKAFVGRVSLGSYVFSLLNLAVIEDMLLGICCSL